MTAPFPANENYELPITFMAQTREKILVPQSISNGGLVKTDTGIVQDLVATIVDYEPSQLTKSVLYVILSLF